MSTRFHYPILAFMLLLVGTLPSRAQNVPQLWGSVTVEKDMKKGFDASLTAEYRSLEAFGGTDRWSVGLDVSKRLYRTKDQTFSVKGGLGVKYMNVFTPAELKSKADGVDDGLDELFYQENKYAYNKTESYWQDRMRYTASVSARKNFGNLGISLRERFQYTVRDSISLEKQKNRFPMVYDSDLDDFVPGDMTSSTETVGKPAQRNSVLRSRLQADYKIKKLGLTPFVQAELFSDIDDGFSLAKVRAAAGTEYKINKHNFLDLEFLWQDSSDDDEPAGCALVLGYTYSF